MKYINWLYCLLFPVSLIAQDNSYPQDFLDKSFHQERREALREMLPDNSVAVLFANAVRNRANDVEYVYHQAPDFYYLTGYREPHAVLLIFSDEQKTSDGKTFDEAIFIQKRNPAAEMWTGKRMGVDGVKKQLGFDMVFNGEAFKEFQVNFPKFDKVFFLDFNNDVRNTKDEADLYDLIASFKDKSAYPPDYDSNKLQAYAMLKNVDPSDTAMVSRTIAYAIQIYPALKNDKKIMGYLNSGTPEERQFTFSSPDPETNLDGFSLNYMMATLREVKSPEEIDLLRKAVNISCVGQVEVMKAMHPGMSETEVQGIHEFVFKKYGAEYEGYPSIVGAGSNGCVLHYITNDKMHLNDDLVLMDLGAEYRGYTADVTRTIPANGKFTQEQKAIYDLVYKAQEESFKICKPGNPIRMTTEVSRKVINEGLAKLGIIKNVNEKHTYFPHGVSHHIGLDVHDPGNYENFEPDMVLTVEPGIYIPPGSPCHKKWWGIAVRIEDDILITENGYELLSGLAPRTTEDIEKMMEQESIFSDYALPEFGEK